MVTPERSLKERRYWIDSWGVSRGLSVGFKQAEVDSLGLSILSPAWMTIQVPMDSLEKDHRSYSWLFLINMHDRIFQSSQ